MQEQHWGRWKSRNKGWELGFLKDLREATSSNPLDPATTQPLPWGPEG